MVAYKSLCIIYGNWFVRISLNNPPKTAVIVPIIQLINILKPKLCATVKPNIVNTEIPRVSNIKNVFFQVRNFSLNIVDNKTPNMIQYI